MRRPSPLRALRRLGRFAVRETTVVTTAVLGGAGITALGVGLIYPPAGLITAGLQLLTGSVLYVRNGRRSS